MPLPRVMALGHYDTWCRKASRILNPLPGSSSARSLVPYLHFPIIICHRCSRSCSRWSSDTRRVHQAP